VAGRKPRNRA